MKSQEGSTVAPKKLWQPLFALGCLLAVALVIAACTSSKSTGTTSGMGAVKVSLSDPATCMAPDGPYAAVWVTITDVQANISSSAGSSDSGWTDLTPGLSSAPIQVNLLGQANNQCFLKMLGDNMELQAGTYQQIRLMLADNSASISNNACTNGSANCVQLSSDSSFHTLNLSSEAQTGLKIPPGQIDGGGIKIAAGQTEDLNIDFNTCESIVREGNGQFRLKPVLHAGEVGTTSVSMNGKVVTTGNVAVAGALVSLEQPDSTGVDRILMSTTTASDGTWSICPVMVGDTTKPYDVVITGGTSGGVLYAPSIVTGISIGSTVGTVMLNPPASGNATAALSTATVSGQVTSVNASSAGTPIDAALSVLVTLNSETFSVPLPMTATQNAATAITVTTAAQTTQNPACNPSGTDCANYLLQVPSTGAYIGTWASSGASLSQPNLVPTYAVDGMATVSGSTTTADCNPSEVTSSAVALAGSPLAGTANLAFTGCQ